MSVFDESMSRRSFAKSAAAVSAGIALGVPASAAVLAQDATPVTGEAPGLPPLPEGATVVASGLTNPRFIAIADDGTLYITENGVGGEEVIGQPEVGTGEVAATPGATPVEAPPQPPSTRGYTGQITRVTPDGEQSLFVGGLASYSDGAGPNGITIANGEVYFDIGGIAVGAGFEPLPEENSVYRLNTADATVEQIVYLGQYEIDLNPDGTDVNPNLYGMATAADGRLLVADAGGNTIYAVDASTGEVEVILVVPPLGQLPGAEAAPVEQAERQPVPTDVATIDGGGLLVGLLSEGWPVGAPSVLLLNPDGTLAAAAGTLFFNVAIAIGPDNQLYASELFGGFLESGAPAPGRVVRVYADGTVEPVLEGVMAPHGINFDASGNMYVVINSISLGPGVPVGQVIRVDGVAAV